MGAVAPCLKGDSGKIVIFKVTKRIKNVYLRYQDKDRTNFTELYFNRVGNVC
jgi:hypothetical protein